MIFFFKSEKSISPADKFLLNKCISKNEKMFFFSNLKKFTSTTNVFVSVTKM